MRLGRRGDISGGKREESMKYLFRKVGKWEILGKYSKIVG